VPQVTAGGTVSRLTTAVAVAVPPDDVAVHVNVVPVVSPVTEAASQPLVEVTADSASWTSQLTATLDVNQPFEPWVPERFAWIVGGVRSSSAGRQSQTPRYGLASSGAADAPKLAA
jgi:hypothetical protein